MTFCPTFYLGCQDITKTKKLRIHTLDMCCSNLQPVLTDKFKDERSFPNMSTEYEGELGDHIYMTWLILKYSSLDFHTMTTYSQRLFMAQEQVQAMERINQTLPPYVRKFELVFAKNNFDVLPEHYQQNHTIKLILGAKLKSSKVYLLLL